MRTPLLALAVLTVFAFSPAAAAQGSCTTGTAQADLDGNNVRARMFNAGNLFFNGGNGEYEVPKGSGLVSIFAAGLWLGGTVDGEVRTAAATYAQNNEGFEFWPGPLAEDGSPPDDCSVFDRIYLVSQADIDAYDQTGTATDDLADWPADLGAPVADGDGVEGNYDLAAGDRPELQGAAQTAWWVMNDAGNAHLSTQSQPLGMEVRVQALAFVPDGDEIPDYADDATFYSYTLVYRGQSPVEALYASFWSDGDLGNFEDDYIGSVPEASLGYTYNADNNDQGVGGYGPNPPAVGVAGVFVNEGVDVGRRAPFAARSGGGGRAPLSSVMYYNNVNDSPLANPGTAEDYYNLQRARWLDGTRLVTGADGYYQSPGANGPATPFAFSGEPPAFWSEYDTQPAAGAQPNAAGDRRSIQTFGPFTLQPGESVELGVGVLWARADGGAIASRDALVAQAFDLAEFESAPEPVFGNTLAPLSVTVPQNQTATLDFAVSNPGGDDLTFELAPGGGAGSGFFEFAPGLTTIPPGATDDALVDVTPDGAAVGTYTAEIRVASNDRNVVTATIPVTITVTMAVAGEDGARGRFALAAPRPNPAASAARLDFETATAGPVRLSVVDVLGREVLVAVDEARPAGAHHADLDLGALPSGAYVVRLRADGQQATQRLTVVR